MAVQAEAAIEGVASEAPQPAEAAPAPMVEAVVEAPVNTPAAEAAPAALEPVAAPEPAPAEPLQGPAIQPKAVEEVAAEAPKRRGWWRS
jgi:hypothetical protein